MDDGTRVSVEAPIFGLDGGCGTCFAEEAPSPSRDPPAEREVREPRAPGRRARSLAAPAAAARALAELRPLAERVLRRWGVPAREAPDVAQKLVIELLPKWAGRQGRFPDKPREYVIGAARKAAMRFHRRRRERAEVLKPNRDMGKLLGRAPGDGAELPTAEDALISADTRAELAAEVALDVLASATTPERWRTFHAHVVEQLPVRAIAALEQAPIGTIYNRLRLARRDLRAAICRRRAANHHR